MTETPTVSTYRGFAGRLRRTRFATRAAVILFGGWLIIDGLVLSGLRPTFGRISRYGVMALSWTQDRLGPICRYAEDTAIVMQAIAKPDGRDMSVSDVPFNWDARFDIRKLKVGIIQDSFNTITNASAISGSRSTGNRAGVHSFLRRIRALSPRTKFHS